MGNEFVGVGERSRPLHRPSVHITLRHSVGDVGNHVAGKKDLGGHKRGRLLGPGSDVDEEHFVEWYLCECSMHYGVASLWV